MSGAEVLTIYEPWNDHHRPVTQADVDELVKQRDIGAHLRAILMRVLGADLATLRELLMGMRDREEEPRQPDDLANLRMRAYPNPMRDDGLFVAEDLPIQPYPAPNEHRAPPVAHNARGFYQQLDAELARRIVACVNHCVGKRTEDL